MNFLTIFFLFMHFAAATAKPLPFFWTPHDRKLYEDRHFIELEHRLVMVNGFQLLKKIQKQEADLAGCRELHHGRGGITAVIKCMDFINREEELGLFTRHRLNLVGDISILCGSILSSSNEIDKLIVAGSLRRGRASLWQKCNDLAWRQVYLTTYANFDARPIETLAFFRRAELGLRPESPWAQKTKRLLEKLPTPSNP